MSFARFMDLALYHPEVGYYRRDRARVGRRSGTDFFTASTSGPIFGELVSAACAALLGAGGRDPAVHHFVEIGAEPDAGEGGIMAGVTHPFKSVETRRLGDPLELAGDCVVFSNELFDAQPCVRSVWRGGQWRELGVELRGTMLQEIELKSELNEWPLAPVEGYRFDRPLAAAALAGRIAAEPWRGLFVAIDYGKTLRQLAAETPEGTARAYFRHRQGNDLLARPGEQDLTCHVCWDWLVDALRRHGFAEPKLDFQEAFFIRNAGRFIAATSVAEAARLSQRKLALMQLLHPSHLGQKFQALYALR